MLGVRLPQLRALAKELARAGIWRMPTADDAYMEEIMLRGMLIGYAAKARLEERLCELEAFVPLISNWSVCDSCCTTYTFARANREQVWNWLQPYLNSAREYEARFGVVMLLNHFRQERTWAEAAAKALPQVPACAYYAEMAIAWCACELILHYPELKEALMDELRPGINRLTHRKLRESFRTPR